MTAEGREHCQQFETKFTKHFHFHFSRGSFIFNFNWVNWWRHVCLICGHQSSCSRWTDRKPLFANVPEKQIFPSSLSLFQRQHHLEHQLVECLICVRHRTAVVAAVGGWTDRKPVPKINSCPAGVVFYFGHHQYFCKYLLDIQPIVWHCAAPMAAGSVKIW